MPRASVLSAPEDRRIGLVCGRTRRLEWFVGVGKVEVVDAYDPAGVSLRVHLRRRTPRPPRGERGGPLWFLGERVAELVAIPAFGRATRLVWRKRRWHCPARDCLAGTVTVQD